MWLLSTDRAELHFFPSSDTIDGGYAIISHTWGHNESTFQDLQELTKRCTITYENPRDLVAPKIRNCCVAAACDGFQWVWIDTCCIDKTSSSDLSEAINSMFRWYSESEVCYAILADVPSDDVLDAPNSAFRGARWHARGWTLQELIAPIHLIFLSPDQSGQWTRIGNKLALASLLHEITGVLEQVLTRRIQFYDLSYIAERMAWASTRTTTRIEDEAYALMGLFKVNMPTIYGEGRQAFRRLQEEIMKQSFDSSLFAWGDSDNGLPDYVYSLPFSGIPANYTNSQLLYLLAPSPRAFSDRCGGTYVEFTPASTAPMQPYLPYQWSREHEHIGVEYRRGPFGSIELPEFSMTSFGVKCRFPIADLGDGYIVAVLLCNNDKEHIGLLLHPSNVDVQDPCRKIYNVGHRYKCVDGSEPLSRLAFLGSDIYALTFKGTPITATWHDIYIAEGPPPALDDHGLSLSYSLSCIAPAPPFRIPRWLVRRLEALGLYSLDICVHSMPVGNDPLLVSLAVQNMEWKESLWVVLGTCAAHSTSSLPAHWAKARSGHEGSWGYLVDGAHDCAEHHIAAWPGGAKTFGDAERAIRLAFMPCALTPEYTLVLHLELGGSVYERLQRDKGVRFPSLAGLVPSRSPDIATPHLDGPLSLGT